MSTSTENQETLTPPTLQEFVDLHKSQLENLKIPKILWKVLHKKLFAPKLIEDEELFEITPIPSGGFQLKAKTNIRRWADLWVIPHIAAGDGESLYKLLRISPDITQYLWDMIGMDNLIERSKEAKEDLAKRLRIRKQELEKLREEKQKVTDLDNEAIEMVMEQADVTRERAVQALAESQGDLVQAIAECMLTPEFKEIEAHINKSLYGQHQNLDGEEGETYFKSAIERKKAKDDAKAKAAAETGESTDDVPETNAGIELTGQETQDIKKIDEFLEQYEKEKTTIETLTDEAKELQRVITLYHALFDNHYVNFYLSMLPRGPDSKFTGPIQPEEIIKTYYIMDKSGSAVTFNQDPNVKLEHFICLSSGNSSWSIMYAEKDIKAGDIIYRPFITPVPCPIKFEW